MLLLVLLYRRYFNTESRGSLKQYFNTEFLKRTRKLSLLEVESNHELIRIIAAPCLMVVLIHHCTDAVEINSSSGLSSPLLYILCETLD
jgi:hypothetical protein